MDGRVLVIAGSDSGGGAGIQADIKTISALGAYAASAITMVTVQNTMGVHAVHDVPTDVVRGQINCVLTDIGADALKIGMVKTAPTIMAVAEEIDPYTDEVPMVLDPIMVAKGDTLLLDQDAVNTLRAELVLRAEVLTPNIPEAEILSGIEIITVDDMKRAAEILLTLGAQSVLVKGGHLESSTVSDVLMTLDGIRVFSSPRIETRHTHGTGCTLASAIAAGLAQKRPLIEAVENARDYIQVAIAQAPGFGNGHGPLNHFPMID
jgi:hydroxymethylpyrimidine/phosphomethylpyrimidine kinase